MTQEKNLLAEKVIAVLRTRDTHQHKNVNFMTINVEAVRHLFDTDSYLKRLSLKEHNTLQKQMQDAQAAREQAETEARERAEAAKRQAAESKQKRIEQKLLEEKKAEEERKNRIADSRKSRQQGQETEKTFSFHARRNNMQRAKEEQKKRGPLPHAKPVNSKKKNAEDAPVNLEKQ